MESTNNVLDVFFWRMGIKSQQDFISSNYVHWSKDNANWFLSPLHEPPFIIDFNVPCSLTDPIKNDITELVKNKDKVIVPVHHELYREAWELRNNNPRSSLVIGICALEVSIQQTFKSLNPNITWLVEELQSPPVIDILKEDLPKLPAINKINNEVLLPPARILDEIKKAVTSRNNIVHKGMEPPGKVSLINKLIAIRDVLWLLDYYCGQEWAHIFISKETWADLNSNKEE